MEEVAWSPGSAASPALEMPVKHRRAVQCFGQAKVTQPVPEQSAALALRVDVGPQCYL